MRVEGEDPLTGHRVHTSTAYLTFVAVGADGHPTNVPVLEPVTDDEKRRFRQAEERRKRRLELRRQVAATRETS